MMFPCQACGQHPFTSLQPYQEYIDKQRETPPNSYTDESPSLRRMANKLGPYVESLRQELETASKVLKTMLELSAPIFKLPNELLSSIFEEVFFSSTSGKCARPHLVHPFTLVCKRWRNIIISTPKFWTRIYIPRAMRKYLKKEHSLSRFIKLQLDRVGATPPMLPLALDCSFPLSFPWTDLLRPVTDRITSLHTNPRRSDVNRVLGACFFIPKLSRLSCTVEAGLDWNPDLDDPPAITLSLSPDNFPSLTDLTLEVHCSVLEVTLPWAQLTSLSIFFFEMGGDFDPCELVIHLEKIQKLELNFGSEPEDFFTADRLHHHRITLSHLHSLALTGYELDFPFEFLRQSNLPSLRELSFRLLSGHEQFVQAMSNPRIWTIVELQLDVGLWELSSGYSGTNKVGEIMKSLRGLECLEVFSCNVNRGPNSACQIFQALDQEQPSNGPLFPCLRELEIYRAEYNQETLDSAQVLVQSRVSPVTVPISERRALRTVRVYFEYTPDSNAPEIFTWTEKGFDHTWFNDRVTSVEIEIKPIRV